MTVAAAEKSLLEIDQELQGVIDELIGGRQDYGWQRKLEKAADLILNLKTECRSLPATSSIEEMLKRIGRQIRTVTGLLEQAATFYCGYTSLCHRSPDEYGSSGVMQQSSADTTVRLRA